MNYEERQKEVEKLCKVLELDSTDKFHIGLLAEIMYHSGRVDELRNSLVRITL